MQGRSLSDESCADGYRYGFNGKENDNEVKGEGNQVDFGARVYDSRIGKWFSGDHISKGNQSPYQYGLGNPINYLDPDGNTEFHFTRTTSYYYDAFHEKITLRTTMAINIIVNDKPDRFFYKEVEML